MTRAAIIGAGAGGLCAAKYLIARGVEVVIYEAGSFIGGLWVYENDNGASPAYKSLHLNSEVAITAYRDFPFPADSPLYPTHDGVCRYLQAYAERFDLRRHIRFRSRVADVSRSGHGWRVTVSDGSAADFDAVVVASGHQAVPKHPEWRNDFKGEYLHSHTYRMPEPFRDKRVLVVGVGNSSLDIAADICILTKSTVIAARSPVLILPRMLFGVPQSRVLARIEKPWVPWPVKRTIRELLARVVHGTMKQWGFTAPKTRTHPASHPNLMTHFMWNRVRAKPGIQSVSGQEVRFVDGTSETFDAVIAGTGYAVDLPFLAPALRPLSGEHINLFLRVVHPSQRGLYFCGMFNVAGGGNIRMMDDQAEWIAELVTGAESPPEPAVMARATEEEQVFLARHFPASGRYALELDPAFYRRQLNRERRRARRVARPVAAADQKTVEEQARTAG
ncbi:MAG: NAD(P)-binding domain-containing protein [Pseudomonadota bacterium]|nr:NAD(P)-binding domain-containing protein [Pseudomonadota bacterium]